MKNLGIALHSLSFRRALLEPRMEGNVHIRSAMESQSARPPVCSSRTDVQY